MKVVGKFKDECKGQLMLRFVGLRPKLYSFDYERDAHFDCKDGVEGEVSKPTSTSVVRIVHNNKVTAKGVNANVAKKLSFDNYEYCLNSLLVKRVDIRRIGSDLHWVLVLKGGYAMMVFQRMRLGLGKRNCKVYKCSNLDNFKSFKQDQQLSNCAVTFKAGIYMDCYIWGKEYTSWSGLFYHKQKVHNCTNVRSKIYEYEIKNAAKCTQMYILS